MAESIEKNINRLIEEGLSGITPREYRTNKAISLEGSVQANFFSIIRNDMKSFASGRVMVAGISKNANDLYKEITS